MQHEPSGNKTFEMQSNDTKKGMIGSKAVSQSFNRKSSKEVSRAGQNLVTAGVESQIVPGYHKEGKQEVNLNKHLEIDREGNRTHVKIAATDALNPGAALAKM